MGERTLPGGGTLRLVTDDEVAKEEARGRALMLFENRYRKEPESLRAMTGALRAMAKLLGSEDERSFSWELLIDPVLVTWLWSRIVEKYSPAAANRMVSALRRILRNCVRVGLVSSAQVAEALEDIELLEVATGAGHYLPPEAIGSLVASCWRDPHRAVGTRDGAMILMLAGTGIRREELVAATLANLDLEGRQLELVTTKGGNPRTAFFSETVAVALAAWIATWRPVESGPIFVPLTRSGRVAGERPLSAHQLWKVVKRRCEQAGLEDSISTHDFRRYAVGQMLAHGIDLSIVSRVVGHRRIQTTIGYDRRPTDEARRAATTIELPSVTSLLEVRQARCPAVESA